MAKAVRSGYGANARARTERADKKDAHIFAERLLASAVRHHVAYTPKPNRTNYLINYQLHGCHTGWPKVGGAWFVGARIAYSPVLGARC